MNILQLSLCKAGTQKFLSLLTTYSTFNSKRSITRFGVKH